MRRIPQQARGHTRVTRILDAAAELFAEEGYDATTTNEIAERALTSVGSVYQFFPNKQAILSALTTNYQVELNTKLQNALAYADVVPLETVCDDLIDTVSDFYAGNRGFQPVFRAACSKALADASDQITQLLVQSLETQFPERADIEAQQRAFTILLIAILCQSIIPLVEKVAPDQQAHVLPELKRLIRAYLSDVLKGQA